MSGELDLDSDESRSRGSTQRVGWAALALIALAALAGLLGPGPLSSATVAHPSGLVQLEYDRFARHVGDTSLTMLLRPDPERPGTANVWISSEYLSAIQVQQVQPEPDTWTAMGNGVVLAFPVSGPDPVTVDIQIRPDRLWLQHGAVGPPGREPVPFWQLVYP